MTEYTATEVRELVAGLPVLKIEAGAEASEVEALRDALEGADQLVRELPKGERAEALVDDAQVVGRSLWVPVVQNCRLSAGLSLSAEDELSFAVKGDGDELVEYFSAREAMRHLISGAARVRERDVPAPEENGRNTRRAAATRTVAAPDASGVSCKDLVPEEDETQDRAPDADVDRDDVASDGLDQPAGGVRYLGVCPSLEDPAETAPAVRGTRGVHPDWRVRLSCLILARRLPSGATGDVVRLIEFLGEDEATPAEFARTLASWRADLSGEDLVGLSKLDRAGALPASEFSTGCVRRLAEGERASLRRLGGELLLVSGDPERPGRALVADALKAAREVRELREADEAFRLSERVRTEISSRTRRPATLEALVSTIAPHLRRSPRRPEGGRKPGPGRYALGPLERRTRLLVRGRRLPGGPRPSEPSRGRRPGPGARQQEGDRPRAPRRKEGALLAPGGGRGAGGRRPFLALVRVQGGTPRRVQGGLPRPGGPLRRHPRGPARSSRRS